MTTLSISPPFPIFSDRDGSPLENGYIWVGTANVNPITNPIAVYWDAALTQPAALPVRTINGYPANSGTPGRLFTGSADYSLTVQDSKGSLVYSALARTDLAGDISAAQVIYQPAGSGAQSRTVESKLQDSVSFVDFGADPSGSIECATAMQSAIDYVASLGGGTVTSPPGATYRIASSLLLRTGLKLDLNGSTIVQYTDNIPVLTAPAGGFIQSWSVRDGFLNFNTQQTSAQTNGIGLRLADGSFSYIFEIENVQVSNACDGIACPNTTGSFAFVGIFRNFIGADCSRYSMSIDCDSSVGGNTNLIFDNCWAIPSTVGALPDAKGFYFNACAMSQWRSLFADKISGPFLFVQSSSGWFGVLTMESGEIEVAPNQLSSMVSFSNTSADIHCLKFIGNAFKTYNSFVANVTGTISVGATITGATSGATGTVRTTGTGAGTTITYYMTNGTNFSAAENILVGGVSQGTVTTAINNTGNIYLFRATSSADTRSFQQTISQYYSDFNVFTGQNIYDIVPTALVPAVSGPVWVYNWQAVITGDVGRSTFNLADFGTPKQIRYWNGDNRYYTTGMTADAAWDGSQTNLLASAMNAANSYTAYTPVALDRNLRFKSTQFGNDRDGGLTLYSVDGGGAEQWITKVRLRSDGGGNGRLSMVGPANGSVELVTTGLPGVETVRVRALQSGSVLAGAGAALSTSATDGFLYVPTCAGTPTGIPTAQTGLAPIVVNTTNNKLYFFSGGSWRDAGP
jgi:hypothetical protein